MRHMGVEHVVSERSQQGIDTPENREPTLDVKYLHAIIQYWRAKRGLAEIGKHKIIADSYIDAYESMLVHHGYDVSVKEKTE